MYFPVKSEYDDIEFGMSRPWPYSRHPVS